MSRPYYGEEILDEIRRRADIVALVSEYVTLRKSGRSFVGLCPFHQEKTPSFYVDPDKQLFYCFGCGAGGNVFNFLMKIENLTFAEAVEVLAKKTGTKLPDAKMRAGDWQGRKEHEDVLKVLTLAQDVFREALSSREGRQALEYLEKRGLSQEIIEKFQLGYAPPQWDFLTGRAKKAGFDGEHLVRAGLVVKKQNGGYYDRFRHRVMFPIWDASGKLIGFAGRALGDETPKYLNSPDTVVFHKGRELYALNLAKPGIRRTGKVCVMEGYMDVIAAFQYGIDYAVAGMGTAFSREQARALLLLAGDVILSYDQDEAGKRAARRNIEVFRQAGGRTRVLTFSGAKDPDEFLRAFGPEKFMEVLDKALPDVRFIYEEARKTFGIRSAEEKVKVKEAILPVLASLESEFEVSAYIGEISRDLDVREESLARDIELYRRKARETAKYKKSENRDTTGYDNQSKSGERNAGGQSGVTSDPEGQGGNVNLVRIKTEEGIIRALVEKPDLLTLAQSFISENDFVDPTCRLVFSSLVESPLAWMKDEVISKWVAGLCARYGPVDRPERWLRDCIRKLREIRLSELREEISAAQRERDEKRLFETLSLYQKLLREVKSTGEGGENVAPGDFPRREQV
ncbi:MAG: DNA primase [Candidatus Fermentithermobacillus carboniphilus]|uniref:DNA primase n=1 Tax=Candidatus Fermentithermobacillus carboniphilus TaxID=3085328 RepID=A0AAT9LE98_9FIRM|nr:MAG: DNA primase [Candidatus Fermentithermobacillus carboniphilus]